MKKCKTCVFFDRSHMRLIYPNRAQLVGDCIAPIPACVNPSFRETVCEDDGRDCMAYRASKGDQT